MRILACGLLSGILSLASAAPPVAVDVTPDIVYGHKLGMALTMDLFRPKANANGATLLFMVSGGYRSNWIEPAKATAFFQPMLDRGFQIFAVRHGSSPKFNLPEIAADVKQAVAFVHSNAGRFQVDPKRLGVYGGSAGGHLSLLLGTTAEETTRVAAVVAYFPPTDLRGWVSEDPAANKSLPALRFPPAEAGAYSPILHVSPDDAPTLLIHGDKDLLVPLAHSENILAEFKKQKVASELVVIPGAGHGFKGEDDVRAREAMIAWFEKYLVQGGAR